MLGSTRRSVRRSAAAGLLVSALFVGGVTPSVFAQPPEPAGEPADDEDVAVGEVDGTTVAVAVPPAPPPPTTIVVAVGEPPVPPAPTTTVAVAVGRPPVPPTTVAQVASVQVAPAEPAVVAVRPERAPEPPQVKVRDAARHVTAGLAVLSDLL